MRLLTKPLATTKESRRMRILPRRASERFSLAIFLVIEI